MTATSKYIKSFIDETKTKLDHLNDEMIKLVERVSKLESKNTIYEFKKNNEELKK